MFDFLKKKIDGFVDKLTKKEEEKEPAPEPKKPPEKKEKPKAKPPETTPKVKKAEPKKEVPKKAPPEKKEPKAAEKIKEKKPEPKKEIPRPVKPKPVEKKVEKPKPVEKPLPVVEKVEEKPIEKAPKPAPSVEDVPKVEEKPETKEPEIDTAIVDEPAPEEIVEAKEEPEPIEVQEEQIPETIEEPAELPEEPEVEEEPEVVQEPEETVDEEAVVEEPKEKPKERIKIGALGAIKSFITKQVEISDQDVGELLEEFELELLEADVDMGVAESIKEELREKLIGAKVKKDELHEYINKTMKETLVDMLYNENAFDILTKVKESEKPVKIMFLGINGAGKTTTIAKVAKLLLDNNQKVVFAAADTFRAAAIEQMQVHAERLDVKVIKRDYGSDPTSVAYDAMNYAKAHGIDAVLIDTAGRQDTNISLINEMKKMTRVIEPQMKVYIGESIAGNAIIEQISSFNKEIGIDAVILTKLDCDPKGGTMLSINKVTGVPIIYVGMGQAYEDLELFDAQTIVSRIVE